MTRGPAMPAGPAAPDRVPAQRPAPTNGPPRPGPGRSLLDRLAGLTVTAAGLAFLVWAALWLLDSALGAGPGTPDPAAHEQQARVHLARLAAAQEAYRQQDWDGDGQRTYAQFVAHLWRTVDTRDEPLDVRLVERSLAFAMAPSRAIDGYWFEDVHFAANAPSEVEQAGPARRLDPEREWAVAAQPAVYPTSGRLTLLTGSDRRIWARDTGAAPLDMVPHDPAAEGWIELR